jgi:hypothetical protein
MIILTHADTASWLATVWQAIDDSQMTELQHDEVSTAMAWIAEVLGVTEEEIEEAAQ